METARNRAAAMPRPVATFGFQNALYRRERKNRMAARVMKILGSVRTLTKPLRESTRTMALSPPHKGPEIPPSLRTLQKWTAIRIPATRGIPTQWST